MFTFLNINFTAKRLLRVHCFPFRSEIRLGWKMRMSLAPTPS